MLNSGFTLVIIGLYGSFAANFPVPSEYPVSSVESAFAIGVLNIYVHYVLLYSQSFSWNTVPVFCHMGKPEGLFNKTELEFLRCFPMVTIEKGQGLNQSGYAEEKMIAAGIQLKAICVMIFDATHHG